MPPVIEVDPLRLLVALTVVLVAVGLASFRLGWMERRRVEAERRHQEGLRDWRARYWREEP